MHMDRNLFPKEMLELRHWMCWRYVPDPNGGKDKKVPYSPLTGGKAYVNRPWTWVSFDEAVQGKQKYGYDGIGFVFTTEIGIVAIDIDDCISAGGELNDLAKDILSKAPKTFIEKSPTGTGLHMLVHGKLSGAGRRNNDIGLEVYATSRYFTMSGDRWHDCEDTIAEDNGIVDYAYKLALTRQNTCEAASTSKAVASVLTDDELIKLTSASRDGEDFAKLYKGEWQGTFKSQSEADYPFFGNTFKSGASKYRIFISSRNCSTFFR